MNEKYVPQSYIYANVRQEINKMLESLEQDKKNMEKKIAEEEKKIKDYRILIRIIEKQEKLLRDEYDFYKQLPPIDNDYN